MSVFSMVGGVIGHKQTVSKRAEVSDEKGFLSRSNREFRRLALHDAVLAAVMAGFSGIVSARISSGKAVPGNAPRFMAPFF